MSFAFYRNIIQIQINVNNILTLNNTHSIQQFAIMGQVLEPVLVKLKCELSSFYNLEKQKYPKERSRE